MAARFYFLRTLCELLRYSEKMKNSGITLFSGHKKTSQTGERMEIFFTILIMTLVVSLSGVVTRVMPFQIPLPLMQIAIQA
ncbi:hypothetical protein ACLB1O_21950 [Escherichia coli]